MSAVDGALSQSFRHCIEVLAMSIVETDYRWLGIDVSKDRLDVYDLRL